MPSKLTGFGLLASIVVLTAGAVAPASAEFFGCNDRPGKVLYSYTGSPSRYSSSSRYTHEFAAQSTRNLHASSRVSFFGSRRTSRDRPRW